MMRKVQEPKVERRLQGGIDTEVGKHPAFAQISASRVTGSAACYGSDFQHQGYIEVEVRASEHHRTMAREEHVPRDTILRLRMTDAQFASFVTGINGGSYVCATLDEVERRPIPDLPRANPVKAYEVEAEGALADVIARLRRLDQKVGELASSMTKSDRETLEVEIRRARSDVEERIPFVQTALARRMTEYVEKAKVEVDNYATSTMQRLGSEALEHARANVAATLGKKTP